MTGTIRFGEFELDAAHHELRRDGAVVKLQRQQFAVLQLLVERAGQVVAREEIRQRIWGNDTFVDFERGINFAINQIRTALNDDANDPQFVETIPRRGYRFKYPIEPPPKPFDLPDSVEFAAPVDVNQTSAGVRWKSRRWLLSGFGIAALVIMAGLFTGGHHVPWLLKAKTVAGRARTVALTNFPGVISDPVFSPDGKQIAFLWNGKDQGKMDIYVQMIGGDQPLRLTHSGIDKICCLNWSPDGKRISFARCEANIGGVFTIPALGGAERRLTDVTCMEFALGHPEWTLDGKSMLLVDRCVPNGPYGIVVFSLETGKKHCFDAPPTPNSTDTYLKLSPDRRTVAFILSTTNGVGEIYVAPLEGSNLRPLTRDGRWIGDFMWAADGNRIIFQSNRGGALSDRLWKVSVDGGNIEPETAYTHLGALSPDGQRTAYQICTSSAPISIWRAGLSGPGGREVARKQAVVSAIYDSQPQLSPDGTKLAFVSFRSGNIEIWRSDPDGSNPLQLTSFGGENTGTPRWSPDGKWIAFDRRPGAQSQIYLLDVEGRNLHAFTNGEYDNSVPSWSRDGQSIYFASMRSGTWQLWNQKLEGGQAVQITQRGGFTAFESYDGKSLYYSKVDGEGIWTVPLRGGVETRITAAPRLGYWGAWAVSEAGIYLMEIDLLPHPGIEFYNFKTRKLTRVIKLDHEPGPWSPNMDTSRDGRIVVFSQGGNSQSSLAMVENVQ